ncbi:uncharacterized protein YjbI with pentapeptide repeats [Clostridium pascui]|uniref:pentapeptide repeat-containing protein n=1 Tax=Clostridium pascui TaxID=46609 RepID=UPI00195757E9|nr:pentapeptide repeat-containing protein [Clostridium pascui]MBM7870758.1 uncharacterized protein YjbI with pentapeptide repeats [Clostridium pascui]
MNYPFENKKDQKLSFSNISHSNLRADCDNCFGFCCVALYFSASEGFPANKDAGTPCINLQSDFRCKVHKDLRKLGLKGCIAYDCFGAGQKVAQVTYNGHDWREDPETAQQMYEVFLIMHQIHEMLWYLTEALRLEPVRNIQDNLNSMLIETEKLTLLSADSLLELDITSHRFKVNALLKQTSELVRNKFHGGQKTSSKHQKTLSRGRDFIGKDLTKINLRGENLSGTYLIAANLRGMDLSGTDLIGADLRDSDLRGANLTNSIFLTQGQINAAKGDSETKLPMSLSRPSHWSK